MENIKLSNHFTLAEFCNFSKYPDNLPTPQVLFNLKYGCQYLLEPARREVGPIIINSGFRNPRVNALVGGVKNSQHLLGQAADIKASNPADNGKLFTCIKKLVQQKKINVGQLIWEYGSKTTPKWVHVSLPRVGKPNGQIIYYYS